MKIKENFSLKDLNTFGVEARAGYFAGINSEEELAELFRSPVFKENKKLVLGGGSNILFTGDFEGLVVKVNISGIEKISEDAGGVILEAGAGTVWNDIVDFTVDNNWGGLENLSLIPGTAGAAPIQNIGAYGQELKNVFRNLDGYFISDGRKKTFEPEECRFGYRRSIFKDELKDKFVITKIRLSLRKNPSPDISYGSLKSELERLGIKQITVKDVSKAVSSIRRAKLPDPAVTGNAGSFFKNPVIDREEYLILKKEFPEMATFPAEDDKIKIAAGWLIEKCGWKGKKFGQTGVHDKQALVLINLGNASGEEILNVAGKIKKSVRDKFGIALTEEVNIY